MLNARIAAFENRQQDDLNQRHHRTDPSSPQLATPAATTHRPPSTASYPHSSNPAPLNPSPSARTTTKPFGAIGLPGLSSVTMPSTSTTPPRLRATSSASRLSIGSSSPSFDDLNNLMGVVNPRPMSSQMRTLDGGLKGVERPVEMPKSPRIPSATIVSLYQTSPPPSSQASIVINQSETNAVRPPPVIPPKPSALQQTQSKQGESASVTPLPSLPPPLKPKPKPLLSVNPTTSSRPTSLTNNESNNLISFSPAQSNDDSRPASLKRINPPLRQASLPPPLPNRPSPDATNSHSTSPSSLSSGGNSSFSLGSLKSQSTALSSSPSLLTGRERDLSVQSSKKHPPQSLASSSSSSSSSRQLPPPLPQRKPTLPIASPSSSSPPASSSSSPSTSSSTFTRIASNPSSSMSASTRRVAPPIPPSSSRSSSSSSSIIPVPIAPTPTLNPTSINNSRLKPSGHQTNRFSSFPSNTPTNLSIASQSPAPRLPPPPPPPPGSSTITTSTTTTATAVSATAAAAQRRYSSLFTYLLSLRRAAAMKALLSPSPLPPPHPTSTSSFSPLSTTDIAAVTVAPGSDDHPMSMRKRTVPRLPLVVVRAIWVKSRLGPDVLGSIWKEVVGVGVDEGGGGGGGRAGVEEEEERGGLDQVQFGKGMERIDEELRVRRRAGGGEGRKWVGVD